MAKKKYTPKALTAQSNVSTAQVQQAQIQTPPQVLPPYEYPTQTVTSNVPIRTPFRYSTTDAQSNPGSRTVALGTIDVDCLLVNWNITMACTARSAIGSLTFPLNMDKPAYAYIRIRRSGTTFFLQPVMLAQVNQQQNAFGTCQVVCKVGDVVDVIEEWSFDAGTSYTNVFAAVTFQPFR